MKKLKDVMTQGVTCMAPDSTLREIAMRMKEEDVGSIPICDRGRLTGMVTDRDIAVKAFTDFPDPSSALASDVMSAPIVYGYEDMEIDEAARIMEARQVRRLMVLDQNKNLVGIVSLGDLSTRGASEEISAEVLEKVSEPGHRRAA